MFKFNKASALHTLQISQVLRECNKVAAAHPVSVPAECWPSRWTYCSKAGKPLGAVPHRWHSQIPDAACSGPDIFIMLVYMSITDGTE